MMRAAGLRHALVILIAGCGLGFGSAPAADSGAEPDARGAAADSGVEPDAPEAAANSGGEPDAPEAGADAVREPGPDEPEAPEPRKARRRRNPPPDEWWAHAREVLFEGLELSEEQTRQIDAIIERQVDARERALKFESELQAARMNADKERSAALQGKLNANRAQIKRPYDRVEEIRALLGEEQRPSFDMNRARLVAEGQQPRKKRRNQRRRAGAARTPLE